MHDVEKFFGRGITQFDGIQVRNQIFDMSCICTGRATFFSEFADYSGAAVKFSATPRGECSDNRTNAAANK
jgi:hypothetical protein